MVELEEVARWHPRSADITPVDIFLWVYTKDIVYGTKVKDLDDLKQNIITVIATIDEVMLENYMDRN